MPNEPWTAEFTTSRLGTIAALLGTLLLVVAWSGDAGPAFPFGVVLLFGGLLLRIESAIRSNQARQAGPGQGDAS
ncbi:MAG: hypothetical protein HOV79_15075 [Hamadaea sp.]|nr:hypothetical protein [Hamadaea sp.]